MVTCDESVRTFSITWLAEYVLEDEGLSSREDLNDLLMEAGFPPEPNLFVLTELAHERIIEVTSSGYYSTNCALVLKLTFHDRFPHDFYLDESVEESVEGHETDNYIHFRPASELAVRSLTKKIYYKTSSIGDKCTICLEEFKDGARVATLPCGHEFDDKCILDWFATSHFCPLRRFEFPREDQ